MTPTTHPALGVIDVIALNVRPLEAVVSVSIADPVLAKATAAAVSAALRSELDALRPRALRVVHVRTRKRLARLGVEALSGAVVVVRITEQSARYLVEIVEGARAAGALGVQLVWDGLAPARERVEIYVFAVLEQARATPSGPPVVLAEAARPSMALQILMQQRSATREKEGTR